MSKYSCTMAELNRSMNREANRLGPIRERDRVYFTRGPEPMLDGVRYHVATRNDNDPCVLVEISDNGSRAYRYSACALPVEARHRRAAAAAVSAYEKRAS